MSFISILDFLNSNPVELKKILHKAGISTEADPKLSLWIVAKIIDQNINKDKYMSTYEEFRLKYNQFTENPADNLHSAIQAHLLIEYYLRQYINKILSSDSNHDKLPDNFGYSSMVYIIQCEGRSSLLPWIDSLKDLNKLRNKFAHKIGYIPVELDTKNIDEFLCFINEIDKHVSENVENTPADFPKRIGKYAFEISNILFADLQDLKYHRKFEISELNIDAIIGKYKK